MNIFKTSYRKLAVSLFKPQSEETTNNQMPSNSSNISYPKSANMNIQFQQFPGPGKYSVKLKERSNRIDFTKSLRPPLSSKPVSKLGPGSFEIKPKKSTSVRIGTSKRPPLMDPGPAPGPGKYEYKQKIVESQGIMIKGSSFDCIEKERRLVPGPGQYDQQLKEEGPKFLIPKSQRYDFTKEKRGLPGPIYDTELKIGGPAFKFGNQKRC